MGKIEAYARLILGALFIVFIAFPTMIFCNFYGKKMEKQ